ncbi:MAG: AAA family ATPase [Chitinophagales bacterium]
MESLQAYGGNMKRPDTENISLGEHAQQILLGVTGTNGAGKGVFVAYLKEHFGASHYSVRNYLIQSLKAQGLATDRPAMRALANSIRNDQHGAFIIEALCKQAQQDPGIVIIESIRNPMEIDFLKQWNAKSMLIAIDAPQELRYQRAVERSSSTDAIDFETFQAQEASEWVNDDPRAQQVGVCMERADVTLINASDLQSFQKDVDNWLFSTYQIRPIQS